MEMPLNPATPEIMHIDLNACFAMTEQQANPLLRGRPLGVTNRIGSDMAIIIAPSYEAKRFGVRCGTTVGDAKRMAPGIIILETDPPKYRYGHGIIKGIFSEYAPRVTMKSIDEGVLDFRGTDLLRNGRSLESIGYEIKARVKEELGDFMTVNVGIGTNWFLAKLAASLHKPDGLDIIDHNSLEGVYMFSDLLDLNGINRRFRARLVAESICTPLEFLNAPERVLTKQVFKSINGRHWYLRLRGYEVDDIQFGMRNVGKQYVLHHRTDDPEELDQVLYKLCYYVSRRLKKYDLAASGIRLDVRYDQRVSQRHELEFTPARWSEHLRIKDSFYTLKELHDKVRHLFSLSPAGLTVSQFTVTSYGLSPRRHEQMHLYETELQTEERVDFALQSVNDRYGELTMVPARMIGTEDYVPEKIAFGSTRYIVKD